MLVSKSKYWGVRTDTRGVALILLKINLFDGDESSSISEPRSGTVARIVARVPSHQAGGCDAPFVPLNGAHAHLSAARPILYSDYACLGLGIDGAGQDAKYPAGSRGEHPVDDGICLRPSECHRLVTI